MATRSSSLRRLGTNIYRDIAAVLRSITRPSHKVVPKQRRRSQLLSGFLLLMTQNTLVGSMFLKHVGGNVWMVMAATSAVFLLTYFISRSRYYRVALIIALVIPAVPPVSMAILKPPEINLTAELMYLSLPLLIASVLLTVRHIVILSSSYIACIALLDALGLLDYKILAPLIAYILVVTFIVTAIAAVRKADESEIENRLAERLQTEKTLRESEEKFSKAFQASPVVIAIADLKTGRFLEVNENFVKLTGYTREEALKLSTIDTGIWSNAKERNLAFHDLKLKGKIRNMETVIHHRKGAVHHGLLSADIINIGSRPFVLRVIMDVTKRKFLERKVIEIEEVNKTKNDLLAIVSHELRTPLTSIKGYATTILDHFSRLSAEETKETIRSIDSSADRLAKLIDNLLDTTRIGASLLTLKKSAADISDLVEAAVEEASLLSRNHHIIIKLGKSLPIVYIDVKRIRQVLDNLLDNAVKYSPAGAVTTVSVRKLKNELLISVADQGRGIPGGELTRIFERMYKIEQRLQESNKGIGLGLHVCQRLVEAHGGRIWAESIMAKGSTLKFTLPLTGAPADQCQKTLKEKTDKTPVGHRK